jgi:LSD1 subclass zinc finger protein
MNEEIKQQFAYFQFITNTTGLNLVTCPSCSNLIITPLGVTDITCPHCETTDESCHFPDLYY